LSKDHTVIRFDQRGSGLSERNVDDISFDAWVKDLETVVTTLELENFALLGISQGGPVAIEYLVRHPGLVNKLVMIGSYARGSLKRGESQEEFDALNTLTGRGWGRDDPAYRQMFTSRFMPDATAEQANWFNELQRVSTSPENAVRIRHVTSNIDVLEDLPRVDVPTLVLHSRDDRQVPFEQGRQLSSLILDARFVPLESNNHLLIANEPAWLICLSEVRNFLLSDSPRGEGTQSAVPAGNHPGGLTDREIEVIRLLATGKSNQDIAGELVISFNTVTNHVKNILGKTGCANRTEAAAYAIQHGLN
jgi:pimeloyl-ACP methyl ester carboxylesterase/DNA-binding CsgD family transcriptional regulator